MALINTANRVVMVDVGGEKTGNTGGEGGKNFQSSNLRSDNEEEETKWFNSSKNHFGFAMENTL
ncbi:hypothetical protein OUZ56_028535 [Daphnia magna]|uniref:Uncharacterized protein n=1 Tax=Daphnia magna TaxID=35525 RepID=A0ABR0B463_9CRUS|nr:hypothetical protein OUZ56_028535 [Daphnia magna]